jgi:hypothetical protein
MNINVRLIFDQINFDGSDRKSIATGYILFQTFLTKI